MNNNNPMSVKTSVLIRDGEKTPPNGRSLHHISVIQDSGLALQHDLKF